MGRRRTTLATWFRNPGTWFRSPGTLFRDPGTSSRGRSRMPRIRPCTLKALPCTIKLQLRHLLCVKPEVLDDLSGRVGRLFPFGGRPCTGGGRGIDLGRERVHIRSLNPCRPRPLDVRRRRTGGPGLKRGVSQQSMDERGRSRHAASGSGCKGAGTNAVNRSPTEPAPERGVSPLVQPSPI